MYPPPGPVVDQPEAFAVNIRQPRWRDVGPVSVARESPQQQHFSNLHVVDNALRCDYVHAQLVRTTSSNNHRKRIESASGSKNRASRIGQACQLKLCTFRRDFEGFSVQNFPEILHYLPGRKLC